MAKTPTPAPAQRTAVGYLRRSTDRQEQSIEDQRTAVIHYAREQRLELSRYYIDDAISGTSAKRPAFQEMMADAVRKPRPFSFIVVYDVKRFGRLDNDEAGYYRHILRTHGVDVLYVSENFSGDGTDDLLRPVKQWQAREESRDLSKVTIRGQLSKIQRGCWLGGTPPYGYDFCYLSDYPPRGEFQFVLRYMPDGTKQMLDERRRVMRVLPRGESPIHSTSDVTILVPSDPKRVEVIKRIFRMSVEDNLGFRSIARDLNDEGVPSARGPGYAERYKGEWTGGGIRSILINPIYVGDLVWNRRTEAKFHRISNGRAVERRDRAGPILNDNPESDWVRVEDTHHALVSRRMFDQARKAREDRPTSYRKRGDRVSGGFRGSRAKFLLSGLITCSRCGARYEGLTMRFRKRGQVVVKLFYSCGSYIRRGRKVCAEGRVERDELERVVVEAVVAHLGTKTAKARSQAGALLSGNQTARIKMIRRCVDTVVFDHDMYNAILHVYRSPGGNIRSAVEEIAVAVPRAAT